MILEVKAPRARVFEAARRTSIALLVLICALTGISRAWAKDSFQRLRTIELPGDGGDPLGALPDGRLICVTPDGRVHLEGSAGSGSFRAVATLNKSDFSAFGPAFTEVSPNGQWLAVGNGGGAGFTRFEVGVFSTTDFSGQWFGRLPPGESGGVLHYSAVWLDDRNLAVAGGKRESPSFVDVLDTQSADLSQPKLTRVVQGIGGASGGIAVDSAGNLLTGNGYKYQGPSSAGAVHAILAEDWQAALAGERSAVNFETQATPVIRTLSAAGIAFDKRDNLWVGGRIVFGDNPNNEEDFIAVMDAQAYRAVLAGAPPLVDASDELKVTRLDPEPATPQQTFAAHLNASTGELLVRDTETNRAFVYLPQPSTVSAPVMPIPLALATALGLFCLPRAGGRRLAA